MRVVIQRVSTASVSIAGNLHASIGTGLLLLVGIHKDDLIFTISNYPVKKFGSQGQQKSFLIALRLAQFDWIKKQKGFAPILLLDDIFDKLDQVRVEKLIALVTTKYFGQVFLTDTDEDRMRSLLSKIPSVKKLFMVDKSEVVNLL